MMHTSSTRVGFLAFPGVQYTPKHRSTTSQAYKKTQKALQKLEDMTFSDSEIAAFLPKELKKG
jgi:hypothetical protein